MAYCHGMPERFSGPWLPPFWKALFGKEDTQVIDITSKYRVNKLTSSGT
jgi:hypothetical protein